MPHPITNADKTAAITLVTGTQTARTEEGAYINLGKRAGTLTHITALVPSGTRPIYLTVELISPLSPSATIKRGWVRGGSTTGGTGQIYMEHEISIVPKSRLVFLARNETGADIVYAGWAWWRNP